MKNKLLLSAIALSIATPAIVMPLGGTAQEVEAATYKKIFKDVTSKNVNYDIIHLMAAEGIIKGYSDNTFRGSNSITRYQVASLVYRFMGDKLPVENKNAKIPSDVTSKSEHYSAAVALIRAGLLEADAEGKLNPNKPITRKEMAKILVVAFDVKIKANYDFADTIEGDEETRDYVRALYSNGITTGYLEDATFRPEKSLTRQQFAVFMHRSINVDLDFVPEPIEIPGKEAVVVTPVPTYTSENNNTNYDVTDLSQTNPNVYEKYSGKVEDIKTDYIATPKLKINPTELIDYQATLMDNYRKANILSNKALVPAYKLATKQKTEEYAQYVFKIPVTDVIKILQYVQETGEVFKGDGYVIYYAYQEQGKSIGKHYHIAYK